jgi:predicted permease
VKFPLWRRKQQEQLSEELQTHLDMAKHDRIDRGESPEQAASSARREFGNVALVKETTRSQWGWIWLEEFLQDLRYGARTVRRNPGFALVAILTLVLGIGANTAIFSVVNAVLLRPLPFDQPDRLATMTSYFPKGAFVFMREQARTMDVAANTDSTEFNLTGKDLPVRLTGSSVSVNWFSVLGVQAAMGRTFEDGEGQLGKDSVVILSHSLWERRFGRDAGIVGRSIALDGVNRQIVGVMPADFRFPSPKTELWIPLHLDARDIGDYWGDSYMPIVARLHPGVTLQQASAELSQLRPRILAAYAWPMPNETFQKVSVMSLQEAIVGDVRPRLLALLGAVGLLLLIACANVANLLLARAASRQREIALRTALGAGRWRITRQLMTESVLMSVLGGALGLLAARYGLSILRATLPADVPRVADISVDPRVLLFTAALAILTGIIFGLVPAVGATNVDLTKSLKTGGERSGTGTRRLSGLLVIGEVAVSVVLVVAAGLLVKSLWNLSNSNPGFRPEYVLTARVTPTESFCKELGRCQAFYDDLLTRVRALPGVKDVAGVNGLPLSGSWETIPSDVSGFAIPAGAHVPIFLERVVTPQYLQIMKIPLLEGRDLAEADAAPSAQRVLLVSKATAERFWPGKSAVGQHIKPRWLQPWWTVVGVVGDVREDTMARNLPSWIEGQIYTAYGAHAIRGSGPEAAPAALTLVIRTSGEQSQLAGELQAIVTQLNGNVPVTQVETLHGWIAEAVAGPRSTASLFSIFAALALVLGAVGVYGVISYSVAQRTREIGIRMALGARRRQVLLLIVGQGAKLAAAGVAVGLLGALLLTRLMTSLLYGVGATDPLTYVLVAILLVFVALAASYIPARRAMRVDPVVALRYE